MTTNKDLKKDAKVRLSGNYLNLLVIYFIYNVIVYAFSALSNYISNSILKLIISVILLVFMVPFSYSIIASYMDIVRGKKSSVTDFINIAFKNISKSWKVFLRIILKLIVPIVITIATTIFILITLSSSVVDGQYSKYFIISTVLFFISIIVLFIMNLYYSLSFYILKDNSEKSSKEIVNESHDLMKGNLIRYIALGISFIGWYLLILVAELLCQYFISTLVASIVMECGLILLFPYMTATMIGFYEDLVYDKKTASEKEE